MINGAEIVFDAQTQEDIQAAGSLLKEMVGLLPPGTETGKVSGQERKSRTDSKLHEERASAIDFILDTSRFPMNAREIADQIKDVDVFYTKNGDPVHIVRRVLASDQRFQKTMSGLFTLVNKIEHSEEDAKLIVEEVEDVPRPILFTRPLPSGAHNYRPPAEDDMDDPFADP